MSKIIWKPNPGPQCAFLASTAREVMYGGAASGGKSDALVIAPTRFIENGNHRAIILRRTRRELQEVIDRSKIIYPQICPDAIWNEQRSRWSFPYGSFIKYGFAEYADDIYNEKSNEYNFIGWDELTTFEEKMYNFMLSRNRTTDPTLPLQIRSATNPGDVGHDWVFQRFVKGYDPFRVYYHPMVLPDGKTFIRTRQFIPATIYDNPMVEHRDEYIAGMMEMGEDLANALLYGRWDVFEGQFFRKIPEEVEPKLLDPQSYYVIRCMDYGLNDPNAVYWLVVYPRRQVIDIVAEIYENELSLTDLCKMIQRRQARLKDEDEIKQQPRISVGDPNSMFRREGTSLQTIAQIMLRNGVLFTAGNDDRAAGWAMLSGLLDHGKIRVWKGRAPMLMRTLPTLKYDPNNRDDIYHRGRVKDHCLVAGTQVATEYGLQSIESIDPKTKVHTRAGLKPVLNSGLVSRQEPVWTVELSDGRAITATAQHKFLTAKGFVPLDKLRYGVNLYTWDTKFDTLQSNGGDSRLRSGVIQSRKIGPLETISPHQQSGGIKAWEGFTKKFGVTHMGRYLKAIKSTILTVTRQTIAWRIWNVLHAKNMLSSTVMGQVQNTWHELGHWRLLGTSQKLAEIGIAQTVKRLGKHVRRWIKSAMNVVQSLKTSHVEAQVGSVVMPVNPVGEESQDWITRQENVLNVEQRFRLTSTSLLKLVPVRVLGVFPAGRADVYDLAVYGQPEYIANGIVVHNSADSLRYGVLAWWEQPAPLASRPTLDPTIQDTVYPKMIKELVKRSQSSMFDGLGAGW